MAQPQTVTAVTLRGSIAGPQAMRGARAGPIAMAAIVCLGTLSSGVWSGGVPIPWRERGPSPGVLAHVRYLSEVPHAIGTSAADRIRRYIVGELERYGLEPQIQQAVPAAVEEPVHAYRLARVQNVVARIAGTNSTKAILMVAHYDSARYSPGAGDNAAAVAALLEASRVAAARPARNDIIFLFSDGEEVGMVGANAFAERHPWARDVGVVVNFDGRGNSGPAMLFEHGRHDGWAVRAFGRSAPRPFGNSVAPLLYQWMPNYTDFDVFKDTSVSGLNLAFFGGREFYHAATDTVERLNPRAAGHHVANALALADELGGMDLTAVTREDVVYFDLLGLILLIYGTRAAVALGLTTAIAAIVLIGYLLRRCTITVAGFGIGLAVLPVTAALAASGSIVAVRAFNSTQGAAAAAYANDLSAWALIGTTVLIMWCAHAALRRIVSAESVLAGGLAWWAGLSLTTAWLAPEASYVFAWPAAGAALILWAAARARPDHPVGPARLAVIVLGTAPLLLVVLPLVLAVYAAWPWNWFASVFVAGGLAILVPAVQRLSGRPGWMVMSFLAVIVAILWGLTARGAQFTPEHPASASIAYILNGRNESAVWMVTGPLSIEEEKLGREVKMPSDLGTLARWYRFMHFGGRFVAAPSALVVPPTASLLSASSSAGHRTVRWLVRSPRGAPELSIYATTPAQIVRASIDGQDLEQAVSAWERPRPVPITPTKYLHRTLSLTYFAPPAQGFVLEVEIDAEAVVTLQMVDRSFETPRRQSDSPLSADPTIVISGTTLATGASSF